MAVSKITKNNFQEEVIDSKIPVILDFWAPWCGPCQMMGPVFEELSKEYAGKLKFAKVNTDEEQVLAGSFSIQGIPCLVVTNKGTEVNRIVGFAGKEELKQKIDSILETIKS